MAVSRYVAVVFVIIGQAERPENRFREIPEAPVPCCIFSYARFSSRRGNGGEEMGLDSSPVAVVTAEILGSGEGDSQSTNKCTYRARCAQRYGRGQKAKHGIAEVTGKICFTISTFTILLCDSITPLGAPVVPEV